MGYGDVLKVLKKSPYRVEELEDVYFQSGTMPLQHLEYKEQLKFKQQQVKRLLSKVGGLDDVPVFETIGMDHPSGYRNKAQIPVREIEGKLTTCFYEKRTHNLIPIEDFVIQHPEIDQAIVMVRDILRKYNITAYDEKNRTGDI